MFGFIKRQQRAEHLKLLRQILEMADKLASHNELAVTGGYDFDGGARNDAAICRSTIEDLSPLLAELEAKEGETLPPEVVQPLLSLWKDFRLRLDVLEAGRKDARAWFDQMYRRS